MTKAQTKTSDELIGKEQQLTALTAPLLTFDLAGEIERLHREEHWLKDGRINPRRKYRLGILESASRNDQNDLLMWFYNFFFHQFFQNRNRKLGQEELSLLSPLREGRFDEVKKSPLQGTIDFCNE